MAVILATLRADILVQLKGAEPTKVGEIQIPIEATPQDGPSVEDFLRDRHDARRVD